MLLRGYAATGKSSLSELTIRNLRQILWTEKKIWQERAEGKKRAKKAERRSTEPQRAGSCEEVRFVLVKLAAIWPASELVLEVIFIAAFIAWRALRG